MPQFKTTLKKSDFQEGKLLKSEIGGKSIVIGMVEDKLYAMDSVCSHEGGPLEEGWLEEHSLSPVDISPNNPSGNVGTFGPNISSPDGGNLQPLTDGDGGNYITEKPSNEGPGIN
jgi:hypothetical protein